MIKNLNTQLSTYFESRVLQFYGGEFKRLKTIFLSTQLGPLLTARTLVS